MPTSLKLIAIIGILLAAGLAIAYLIFRQSSQFGWKQKVRAAIAELRRKQQAASDRKQELSDPDAFFDRFVSRYLKFLPIDELLEYPGIGPVTIERLKGAGIDSVGKFSESAISSIAGIGESRSADLISGMRKLRQEAATRIKMGTTPQARGYREDWKKAEETRLQDIQQAVNEVKAIDQAIANFEPTSSLADQVQLWNFLLRRMPEELTPEFLEKPITIPLPSIAAPIVPAPRPTIPTPPIAKPAPTPPPVVAVPSPPPVAEPPKPAPPVVAAPPSVAPTPEPPVSAPRTEEERLRVIGELGLAVAKSDGRIAANEKRQIRVYMERRWKGSSLTDWETWFEGIQDSYSDLGSVLTEIRRIIPRDRWPELYQFAISVADSSGKQRHAGENACLESIAQSLEINSSAPTPPISSGTLPVVAGKLPETEEECRAALEIDPGTALSVDLIRRQYRLLHGRFDPARFQEHGAEFVRMAQEKRAAIEVAAEKLLAPYNEPLEAPAAPQSDELRHNPDLDDVFGG
jgi:hypothetical protein